MDPEDERTQTFATGIVAVHEELGMEVPQWWR